MAVFQEITVGQESQSTIDKHCLLRPFTVFSAPVMAPKSDAHWDILFGTKKALRPFYIRRS
ncbi:hypothetical protein OAJ77_10240 [Rhodospirillales bacterium]|nr:hypothetical protein [Rhodospirillales bacterium]